MTDLAEYQGLIQGRLLPGETLQLSMGREWATFTIRQSSGREGPHSRVNLKSGEIQTASNRGSGWTLQTIEPWAFSGHTLIIKPTAEIIYAAHLKAHSLGSGGPKSGPIP